MRLLNTFTRAFEEFISDPPPYAILSHRWVKLVDEITYEEYCLSRRPHEYQTAWETAQIRRLFSRSGHRKIVSCCAFALARRQLYVWIDTCCIDKRSSADLSEAVNSMWTYYSNAVECYVYMADLPANVPSDQAEDTFAKSSWFSRCWTLQEFLAPNRHVFCNAKWETMFEIQKLDGMMPSIQAVKPGNWLSKIIATTSIPEALILGERPLDHYSAAQKLSWAASRVASRAEDEAYSLLGLFSINMPLLYGEGGTRAFARLQREIINNSDDESIFAWTRRASNPWSPLAERVGQFAEAGNIRRITAEHFASIITRPPYTITNKGLEIQGVRYIDPAGATYRLPLNCYCMDQETNTRALQCVLVLSRLPEGDYLENSYTRLRVAFVHVPDFRSIPSENWDREPLRLYISLEPKFR